MPYFSRLTPFHPFLIRGFYLSKSNIMNRYQYSIDTTQIEIAEPDEEGQYEIFQQNVSIGYIYVSELDDVLCEPIWNGSSPYLNLIAPEIGAYIQDCNL
jgi:hypothetical protein